MAVIMVLRCPLDLDGVIPILPGDGIMAGVIHIMVMVMDTHIMVGDTPAVIAMDITTGIMVVTRHITPRALITDPENLYTAPTGAEPLQIHAAQPTCLVDLLPIQTAGPAPTRLIHGTMTGLLPGMYSRPPAVFLPTRKNISTPGHRTQNQAAIRELINNPRASRHAPNNPLPVIPDPKMPVQSNGQVRPKATPLLLTGNPNRARNTFLRDPKTHLPPRWQHRIAEPVPTRTGSFQNQPEQVPQGPRLLHGETRIIPPPPGRAAVVPTRHLRVRAAADPIRLLQDQAAVLHLLQGQAAVIQPLPDRVAAVAVVAVPHQEAAVAVEDVGKTNQTLILLQ